MYESISIRQVILPGFKNSCPTRSVALQEKNADEQTISSAIESAISSFLREVIGTLSVEKESGRGLLPLHA